MMTQKPRDTPSLRWAVTPVSGLARPPRTHRVNGSVPMHTYTKRWNDDAVDYDQPSYDDFRFRGLSDLIRWAELDRTTAWRTWPDIWHLDDDGAFCCGSKGSSFDGVHSYAEDPGRLVE